MRKFLRFGVLVAWFFVPRNALASTYYIDWLNGNDANSGTSQSTPWKHAPGMQGFAGAYSHAAGDRFIFRGGVTWPNEAFCWRISNGGVSGNPDYYGVDNTFFTGASWTRPIFDGGLAPFTACPSGQPQQIISVSGNFAIIDNFDVQGLLITTSNNDGSATISISGTNVDVQNCYVHRWSHGKVTSDRKSGGIFYGSSSLNGTVSNCIVQNADGDGNSGAGVEAAFRVTGCTIHDIPNAVEGVLSADNNLVYNVFQSFDPNNHTNAMSLFGGAGKTQYVYNNIIHTVRGAVSLFMQMNLGGCSDTAYIYNNVIYDVVSEPIVLDPTNNATFNCGSAYVYNNTLFAVNGSGACVRVNTRAHGLDTVVAENNQCISTTSSAICTSAQNSNNCGVVNHATIQNNLTMSPTTAASQGYTAANQYAPTAATNSTVDAGLTSPTPCTGCVGQGSDIKGIPRPPVAAWNVGAYEYKLGSAPAPPTNLRVVGQ